MLRKNNVIEQYEKLNEQFLKEREDNIRSQKNLLEDMIMVINEIQDIQAIGISEKEKDCMRNSIINCKRSEYTDKIIELDHRSKKI